MSELEDITIQDAADLLNIPQRHLFNLLAQGEIPFTLLVDDVQAYKEKRDTEGHSEECKRLRVGRKFNSDDDCPDADCPWAK